MIRKGLALTANAASLLFPLLIATILFLTGTEHNGIANNQAAIKVALIMSTLGIGWSICFLNGLITLFTGMTKINTPVIS